MRHLDAGGKPRHAAREKTEPFAHSVLLAFLEQDLHAQADTEHGSAAVERRVQCAAQAQPRRALHAEAKRGHPG